MTTKETMQFKRFIEGKGVLKMFEGYYKSYRFDERPIDQYYEEVPVGVVIMAAFDMSRCANTVFNMEYWQKLQEKWRSLSLGDPHTLKCDHCKRTLPLTMFRMNKKGKFHSSCKECEDTLAARTQAVLRSAATRAYAESLQSVQQPVEQEPQPQPKLQQTIQPESTTTKSNETMDDFTFFDFSSKPATQRLQQGEANITICKTTRYLYINAEDGKEIAERGLTRLRIRKDNITGVLHLVFNKEVGATGRVKKNGGLEFINRQLADFLLDNFGFDKEKPEIYRINIGKNLSKVEGAMTYLIQKNVG